MKRSPGLIGRKDRFGYLFVLPFIIGFIWIFLPSLIETIYYSFHDVSLGITGLRFKYVGFENFYRAFAVDAHFILLMSNMIKGMIRDLIVITIFSFFIANILNQKFFLRGFARVVFFLPVILATGLIASVQTGDLLSNIFQSNTGSEIAVGMNNQAGLTQFFDLGKMLTDSNINPQLTDVITGTVSNIYSVVNSSGVQILIFLAGLQSISPSIFESSKVEGATKWEEFWKITFPIMTPIIFVAAIYTLIDTFTKPEYGIFEYIKQWGFMQGRLGYATSLSIIYAIVMILALGIVSLIMGRMISNAQ